MSDKEFLQWIYDRLVCKHRERPDADYMRKLNAIIESTPPDRNTPNTGGR